MTEDTLRLFTVEELAERLHFDTEEILDWVELRRVTPIRHEGQLLFTAREIAQMIDTLQGLADERKHDQKFELTDRLRRRLSER